MKLAITGAAGAFGRHLCARLEHRNVLYVPVTRQDWDLRHWADEDLLYKVFDGADVLVHAAASLPPVGSTQELFDTNLRATINLADFAAQNNKRVIYISSGSVYADPHAKAISETSPVGPGELGGLYATTKRLAEAALSEYAARDLHLAVLRPSAVYGFGLTRGSLIWRLLDEARGGNPVKVHGGLNAINFLHFSDLARAVLSAANCGATGTFNIATEAPTRIADLAHFVADMFGTSVEPLPDTEEAAPFTRFDLDISAARSALDFAPVISLQRGLQMMNDETLLPPDD